MKDSCEYFIYLYFLIKFKIYAKRTILVLNLGFIFLQNNLVQQILKNLGSTTSKRQSLKDFDLKNSETKIIKYSNVFYDSSCIPKFWATFATNLDKNL